MLNTWRLTTIWTCQVETGTWVECVARVWADRTEIVIKHDGVELYSFEFDTESSALVWAEERRREWQPKRQVC